MRHSFAIALLVLSATVGVWAQNTDAASDKIVVVGNRAQPVQWNHRESIQDAINAAQPNGTVIVPSRYLGTDCNPISACNPGSVIVLDWRSASGGIVQPCSPITPGAVAVYTSNGQSVTCLVGIVLSAGTENSQEWGDNVTVANADPGQMKLASVGGVPSIGFNGPLSAIETAANVAQPNGIAGLNASAVLPIAEVVNSLTNCDSSHVIKGDQTCGNALAVSTNAVSNSSQTALNFQDAVAFNGLTFTWTNPGGGGNEKPVLGGSLDLATQNHPSMTINGTVCTLGSSCNPSGSAGSTLLNSQGPATAVTGTGAAATLYTFSIAGGTMSTTSCIRASAFFQHTTGTTSTTFTWNFGATSFTSSGSTVVAGAKSTITVCNNGATNSQWLAVDNLIIGTTLQQGAQFNTSAIDTTSSTTISFQFTVAATDAVTPKGWTVESVH